MNIIIFGPPGAGKGTQADKISNNFNLRKVSTGDLLRKEIKNKTISQIKNFSQEETLNIESKIEDQLNKAKVINFEELINICDEKKELKLKFELETNVSLVSFTDQKIEISFNENLDKNFVKELSSKLYEWTGKRWIIAFSKEIGQLSKKNEKKMKKKI